MWKDAEEGGVVGAWVDIEGCKAILDVERGRGDEVFQNWKRYGQHVGFV